MEFSEQVVAVISECVVKVVKQLLADYNTQLNTKLKNLKITGDQIKPLTINGTNIASGSILGQNIGQGAITGTNIAEQTITGINIVDGSIQSAKINDLEANVMNAVVANIATADIDWASIEKLEAATADIAKATIEEADIDWANITDLNTTVANITHAEIQSADIEFGQIKDFVGGTAIITQGVAGEFYINKLQVTDANIASLTTGKLVLQNTEGLLHELYVDENGNVATRIVEVGTGNIGDGVITGDKIAVGAVSSEQINAAAIFGDEAVVIELTAGLGKFGTLFANEAIIEQLKTHLITSDYLKIHIHDTIDIGGRNLVKKSGEVHSNTDYILATYYFGNETPVEGEQITIRLKGHLGNGKTGFRITNSGDKVTICDLADNADGTYGATAVWATRYTNEEDGLEYEADNTYIDVRVSEESVTGADSTIEWIMVERGNHTSDWTPAPEDDIDATEGLVARVNSVEERITPDKIITTVTESSEYKDDLQVVQQSAVAQTKSDLEIRFLSNEAGIGAAQMSADQIKSQLDTWYHFDADALTIGKSDSKNKTRQDNETYEFLYDGAVTASISGTEMTIPKAKVTDELRLGGMKMLVDKTTGVIEWIWVGFDQEASETWLS